MQKVFPFCSILARKGGTVQLAWKKKETPFYKISMSKNEYFIVIRPSKGVLSLTL